MRNAECDHVIGIPVASVIYNAAEEPGKAAGCSRPVNSQFIAETYGSSPVKQKKVDSAIDLMSKFSKKANNYVQGIRDHVILGSNISETIKGKLSMGTKILQAGGIDRVFRRNFSADQGERLLKAFQCYLSTSAGPISGLLYISNKKIAFHSDRFLTLSSPDNNLVKVPYKVVIPLARIKEANTSANTNKPNQKYMQIVTVDDFEFWFMGFVNYQRSFKLLEQAMTEIRAGSKLERTYC